MRIVHVVEAFWWGVFDFLVDLTRWLDEMEHIIVYSLRKETPKDFQKYFSFNVKFIQRPNAQREVSLLQDFKAFLSLLKIFKMQKADVYHLHSSKAWFLGRLALKLLGRSSKAIYSVHWVGFADPNFSVSQKKLYKFLEKVAFRFWGKVVGNSVYEAQVFKSIWVPAEWIPNRFDCESTKYFKQQSLSPKSKIIIANMWRLTEVKDPNLFSQIAKHFIFNQNIEFWWIGWPYSNKFKFPSNVKVTGWLLHQEALQKLSQVDIFLFTSLSEAVPMAVLEAMCLAKPVVARKIPWVEEVIEHEKNGFLFEDVAKAKEYLQSLIDKSDLRKKMWVQAYKTIKKKFSFEEWLDQYRSLYQKIAN